MGEEKEIIKNCINCKEFQRYYVFAARGYIPVEYGQCARTRKPISKRKFEAGCKFWCQFETRERGIDDFLKLMAEEMKRYINDYIKDKLS